MLLSGQKIVKEYGTQKILDIDKLVINDGDRIGLVGRNGTGKSTLLGILSGRIMPDSGVVKRECEIAEILQDNPGMHGGLAGADSIELKGGLTGADGTALNGGSMGVGDATLNDGYADMDYDESWELWTLDGKYVSHMGIKDSAIKSGGERMRLAIARAFSEHAPLLFADEPTTNLDMDGVKLLEKMLGNYRGAVVMISHDRALLDAVCNQIWELDDGELRIYPGNYSSWYQERQRERDFQQFEYEQYRNEKRRLEKRISQVQLDAKHMGKRPTKMSNSEWMLYKGIASQQQGHVEARSKAMESRLSHLEVKEKPKDLPNISMKLPEGGKIKAKYTAKVENLNVSYGDKQVLTDASIRIESGKKTFIVGENGAGKSTLIKALLAGKENTFITSEAKTGYFSQDSETLDYNRTVIENVTKDAAAPEYICRAVLMNLYMQKQDMDKKVSVLSGGERVKTAIAKVLVSGCNFIILDEPTNHMDIYTMEGLENLLGGYDGTALIISHDRKLVENLADKIYTLNNGAISEEY